jgi:hypothetical protein
VKAASQEVPSAPFKRIAIAPFVGISPAEAGGSAYRCPICGAVFSVGPISDTGISTVEDLFVTRLEESAKFTIITPDRVGAEYNVLAAAGSFKTSPLALLKKTGEKLGADVIVYGAIYRFRERKGYSYSVEQPASVSFAIHLIRVSDGIILWSGVFDKTQTSLMENVLQAKFFYKEKGKWVTAKELARSGMDDVLKTFPSLP